MLFASIKFNPAKKVDKAEDGKVGLDMMEAKLTKCCKQPYSIVIIDLNMPECDGIEMIK